MQNKAPVQNGNVEAGLIGATGGTTLMAFVSILPEHSEIKQFAQFIAPTLTILLSIFSTFALTRIRNFLADKELEAEINKAEGEYQKIKTNGSVKNETKKEMRDRIDALRLLKFSAHTKRVETIIST